MDRHISVSELKIISMASAKPIGVGVGIGIAVEIGKRKATAIPNPIATPIIPLQPL
jgi:hypothetical protein